VRRTVPDGQQIPEKVYFRIGEVSSLVGVDPHVLRYWETEFSVIKPFRGKSKQRLYRRQDVETLLEIKVLLHDEGYTISGARKLIKGRHKHSKIQLQDPGESLSAETKASFSPDLSLLGNIKTDLKNILEILRSSRMSCEN